MQESAHREGYTANATLKEFLRWCSHYGLPDYLMSDNGAHYVNAVLKKASKVLHLRHETSPALLAWVNGRVERMMRSIIRLMLVTLSDSVIVYPMSSSGSYYFISM